MLNIQVREPKYTLRDVILKQRVTQPAITLFEHFLNEVVGTLQAQGRYVHVGTHEKGVTLYCPKAFIYVDLWPDFFSAQYFTDDGTIEGLTKSYWHHKGDNLGSEKYRVRDQVALRNAIRFALESWSFGSKR